MSFLSTILPRSWVSAKGADPAKPSMDTVIVPMARDRWLGPTAAAYTPERVEQILRGTVSGDLRAQQDLFDLMEETWPRLLKNLGQLKDTVVGMEWTVQPWTGNADQVSPEAKKKAELVEGLIWNMTPRATYDENGWEDTVRDLLDARGKGISVLEIDWEQRAWTGGSAIGPRCTRWVHPRFYGYPIDGEDRLMLRASEVRKSNGGNALSGNAEWEPFPDDKFIIGVCKAKTGHPLRGALLRALGFWWVASNFSGEWLLNFSQLFGQPLRWATYDKGLSPADKKKLAGMLENMGSAAWGMFPAGTVLELKEAMKSGTDNPQTAVLDIANTICDILILRQTLTTDVGDSGSRALGDVHQDVLGGVEGALGNWAARILTDQLVRPICRLNFGNDRDCPWLMPGGKEESEDPKAAAERDAILMQNQVPLPKEWFYTRHQVPMPGPDDEVITGPGVVPLPAIGPDGAPLPGESTGAEGGANAGGDVQATALNGAQVTALADLAEKVAQGLLPYDTGLSIATAAFPLVPSETILKIFTALRRFKPAAPVDAAPSAPVEARAGSDATEQLVDNVLEELTGVKARWLAGVKPYFAHLVDLAKDDQVSDADLVRAMEALSRQLPELANKLDASAVQMALEKAMGTALVNGAVHGHLERRAVVKAKASDAKKITVQRNERGHLMGVTIA